MSAIQITDLVSQEAIDKLKELDREMQKVLDDFEATAKELAKGLEIKVKVVGDLEKLEKLATDKTKECNEQTQRLNSIIKEQQAVVANTTNTISRQLMEQERVNKANREAYTGIDRVKKLLEEYNGSYDDHLKRLVSLSTQIANNNKAQKEAEKALKAGRISATEYQEEILRLTEQHRGLTQEKRTLQQIMTAEEKAMQTADGSYVQMSQQLELLKKSYKDLNAEARDSDIGREMEAAIQDLDAHLKDVAADMGEFQRNVGNYAIAGQNGVVSTESLIAVLQQEAITAQDVADQTKILEEAKLMLNQSDANYQQTLDTINAKLEENRRKLSDVSDILGVQAKSVVEAEAQNKRLNEAIKHVDLTSEDAKKKIEALNAQIEANKKVISSATGANDKFADSMLKLIGVNSNFGRSLQGLNSSGNFIEGLNTKVGALGKTLMGLLANPWVLAFLGIAGVVAGVKWWYEYNKGMAEASRLTQNFTGLTGAAADKVTTDMQTLADKMGKGYDDTIGAANTLVQQFGITWEEAMSLIQDGIVTGADLSGNLLNNINQFAPAMRDAGVGAEELIAILAQTRNGIFDEKGVQDIIKGGTRLRAMTKQVASSLDAVGISSKQMQEDLAKGNITMLDAVQQVAAKLKELPENSQEAGNIIKNVFGRTAAEGGMLLVQSLADVNTNLDDVKGQMTDVQKLTNEQIEAEKELNSAIAAVFKMGGTTFEELTIKAKTYVTQGLTKIVEGLVDVANWFINLYNQSIAVRGSVQSIGNGFKILWEVVKFVCSGIINLFKSIGTIIEGVFTLSPSKIQEGIMGGLKAMKDDVVTLATNIAANTAEAFNNTLNDTIEPISLEVDTNAAEGAIQGVGGKVRSDKDYASTNKEDEKEAKKRANEREKAAKKELKLLQEFEDSKIAIMKDGHEKDLALIRQKYKKKLDQIKGDGQTETELRLQLAEQCEKEVAECELKYQRELAQINLENRLAAVEEGSREELDLKLAQLETSRQAELEAAEKTGADVNLIEEKYQKQRLKLKEDYASKAADKIQAQAAQETKDLNNEYLAQVVNLKQKYAKELAEAGNNSEKREQIEKKFNREMENLADELAKATLRKQVRMYQDMLNNADLSAEERLSIERELYAKILELSDLNVDIEKKRNQEIINDDDNLKEKRVANISYWLQVASDALNKISELSNALFDRQIQQIEELQEANQEAGDAEQTRIQELVDKKVITEEEGEARKRAAEAKTAQKESELERKKAQLQKKQAIWNKANSVAQAAIATALSLIQLWAKPGWPAAIPLMAVVGALGASSIATILATPIPQYAKGTDYHKGGPAIVGDGGEHEVVVFRGNAWLTPDSPTLVDLPTGASVIPDTKDLKLLTDGIAVLPPEMAILPASKPYDDGAIRREAAMIKRGIYELGALLKTQTKQQHRDAYNARYELYKNRI